MRRILLLLFISNLPFSGSAQIGKWTAGCYYTTNGGKVCGIIKWNVPSYNSFKSKKDNIQFKKTDTAEKIKISTDSLHSFVIKADSFVVTHYAELAQYPVLNVLLNSPLKLYVNLRENVDNGAYNIRYYYGEDGEHITKMTRKNFIEAMSQIIADDEALAGSIKNGGYNFSDMDELLKVYHIRKKKRLNE